MKSGRSSGITLRRAVRAFRSMDAEMRAVSACSICGKPKAGIRWMARCGERGAVTGIVYDGQEPLLPVDAGLCSCGLSMSREDARGGG